jgi:hypothetical protein
MPNFVFGLAALAVTGAVIGFAFWRASRPSKYQRSDVSNPGRVPGIWTVGRN